MKIVTVNKGDYTLYDVPPQKAEVTAVEKQHTDAVKAKAKAGDVAGDADEETAVFSIPFFVVTLDINRAVETLSPVLSGMLIPAVLFSIGLGSLFLLVLAEALLR